MISTKGRVHQGVTSISDTSPTKQEPAPRHRIRRRLLWACAAAILLAAAGVFLATRSFVLEAIARPHIMATVGGEIEIGRVRWVGWTQLEITDLSVRAPGWTGPSGEVIRIDRARIQLDSSALKRGSFQVNRVKVEGMLVRVAEDTAEPGKFSILSLAPEIGEGGTPPSRIDVKNLELQMGIDRDGQWERTGSLKLAGDLKSGPGGPGIYDFEFITKALEDSDVRSVLKGELNTNSLAFYTSIDDLEVGPNLLGLMPMELRRAAQALELQGHVDRIEIAWDGDKDLYAAIKLDQAQLVIPDIAEDSEWARLDDGEIISTDTPPIMEVRSGLLALVDDRITLENFEGQLKSDHPDTDTIPVILDFEMDLAPVVRQRLDWSRSREVAERIFSIAPFNLTFTVPDFKIRRDGAGIVLPEAAARTIAQFGVEEWLLDLEVHIIRDMPLETADGSFVAAEALTDGQVRVQNGIGRYSRFPFPLQNVQAHIEFDDERVDILNLTGKGPNGGIFSAMGSITDPGPAAAIDVKLYGSEVPADDVFRSALQGWRLRTWDQFFDKHAEAQLREAGMLPDEDTVKRAKLEQARILNQLANGENMPEKRRAELLKESRRLKRIIEAGPFQLGGMFDFELTVTSEAGIGKPVDLTGRIKINEGDVILSDFPLPTHVLSSEIILEPDLILLGSGINFTTPRGGSGLIRGSIDLKSEDKQGSASFRPDISFAAIDVTISPALLAALPPGDEDKPEIETDWPARWYSEAAIAMQALGITGQVDLEGLWRAEEDGEKPELSFDANLTSGAISPDLELEEFFERAGFVWPEGFTLANCQAKIHLDDSITRLTDFIGYRNAGIVTADGYISRVGEEQALHVAFREIEFEEYLLNLVPEGSQEETRRLWDRFRPRGTFDADLDWSRDSRNQSRSLVVARPGVTTLDMDGEDVEVETRHGEIRIRPHLIEIDEMLLNISQSKLVNGEVLLDGSYGRVVDEEELSLKGEVVDGRFESPLLPVLLDLVGASRVRDSWLELDPSGRFNSHFEYRVLPDGNSAYAIDIAPENISATLDEDRVHGSFDSGTIVIIPQRIDLENLSMRVPAPGTIDIDATVIIGDEIELQAALDYELEEMGLATHAYLPPPLSTAFESVDFTTRGALRLSEGRLKGRWKQDSSIDEPESYDFDALVEFSDAGFTAGATFEQFDGDTRLSLRSRMGEDGRLINVLDAPITGRSILVQDRLVTDPKARIRIKGDELLTIDGLSGHVAGGWVVGDVIVDLEAGSWELEIDLEDASLQELSRESDAPDSEGTIGSILANIHLFGFLDDPQSKRGRGRLIIEEGEMTNSPLTLSIVQLSQLMLPVSDSLEFAEISFTIDGNRMVFDDFYLSSPTLRLDGSGEMSLLDWELALRLYPKGTVPILSDLIGGMTGTLFAINVKGTLGAPEASLEALPLLGSPARISNPGSSGSEPDESEVDLDQTGDAG